MNNFVCILLFFLFPFILKGSNVDSIYNLIEAHNVKDSFYVKLIHDYCSEISNKNHSEKDLTLIKEGVELSNKLALGIEEAYMHNFLGWYYHSKSNTKDAILQFQNAIKVLEIHKSPILFFEVMSNLANTYNSSKDFEKALEINLQLIDLIKEDKSSAKKARVFFYTAKTYDRLEDYDNAEIYYLKTKKISEEVNFMMGVIISNSSLAHNYTQQKEFSKAIPLLKQSQSFYESAGQKVNVAASNSSLGNCYVGLNLYESAIPEYEKAIKIYHEIDNITYLKYNYTWLAYSYSKVGEYGKSQENYDMALSYADSLFNQERVKAIEDVKTQYETEKYKQQKELAESNELLANERANFSKKVSVYVGIFSVFIIGLLLFIFNRLKLIRKQKTELDAAYGQLEESKKNELAVSNLKALQSQMNPHFIFNALNSVQDLVLLKDIRNSNRYLGKFSDLIRKILLSSKEQFISLEEEIEILSLYLDLEKLRFGEDFVIDIQCNVSEQQQDEIDLPAMFIQPYIENAIKHGLFHKVGQKILKVHFSIKGNNLECIIQDNGIGQKKAEEFKIKRLHLHTGFSTEAINERIRLLNETVDEKIVLKVEDLFGIDNEPTGTKITLLFPIN